MSSTTSTDGLVSQFRKTKLCPWFPQGLCVRGDECNYAHDQEELRTLPDLKKTTLCASFLRGRCKKSNDQCRYAHGIQELRSTETQSKTGMDHVATSSRGMASRFGSICRMELRSAQTHTAPIAEESPLLLPETQPAHTTAPPPPPPAPYCPAASAAGGSSGSATASTSSTTGCPSVLTSAASPMALPAQHLPLQPLTGTAPGPAASPTHGMTLITLPVAVLLNTSGLALPPGSLPIIPLASLQVVPPQPPTTQPAPPKQPAPPAPAVPQPPSCCAPGSPMSQFAATGASTSWFHSTRRGSIASTAAGRSSAAPTPDSVAFIRHVPRPPFAQTHGAPPPPPPPPADKSACGQQKGWEGAQTPAQSNTRTHPHTQTQEAQSRLSALHAFFSGRPLPCVTAEVLRQAMPTSYEE